MAQKRSAKVVLIEDRIQQAIKALENSSGNTDAANRIYGLKRALQIMLDVFENTH